MYNTILSLLDDSAFKSQVKYECVNFQANQKILVEGEVHNTLYLIQKGAVRVMVSNVQNEISHIHPGIADLGPGDIFGEFALFDDSPASADIVTVSEVELLEIDIQSFQEFLKKHPDIGYAVLNELMSIFVKRFRHSNKTIINLFAWGIKSHHLDKDLE